MVEDYRYNGEAIKAVEMGGLTFESLLIEAGHQERPLTAKEKVAQETVQQYAALSFQARSLWEEIKHHVEVKVKAREGDEKASITVDQNKTDSLAATETIEKAIGGLKEETVEQSVPLKVLSQALEKKQDQITQDGRGVADDLLLSSEKPTDLAPLNPHSFTLLQTAPLKEPSLAFEYTQHEKYSDYLALKDQRDRLAVRIMADGALHRDFVYNRPQAAHDQALEQNEGIRYGLWGIKKQAEEFLAREERLKVVQPLLQQWQQLVMGETLDEKVKRLNSQFEAEFKNRGQIASQILSIILEEKTTHETKVTYQEIHKLGLSYFEILQSARDFTAYQLALQQGNDTALHLISYQQARQVTNQLFGQCSREVEKLKEIFAENKQQNPDAFENKPEPVFWHTASYQLYVQAAAITNDRAFALTQGQPFASLPELKTLTEEMKLSDKLLKGIDLYSRQGEYQFHCREFKGATDSVVKGEKASLLIDELIENKGLFRVFEREQVKMSGLLESLHDYDVRLKKDRLDLSNHPLAQAVFGYTDQRKVVGQAFAKISQEIESRVQQGLEKGVKIPTLQPWNIEDQWGVYLDHRKVLDSQAAAIISSSAEERQVFMERFNLRLSVLKPQSQRHQFAQAYQQTKDLSLSYQDRAQAFYVLEEAHHNRFDDTLRQIASYAVNKQDKAQEKADRDYLKSVQTYNHYAFALLRQHKETVEDFKKRQAAFEQEFKLTDPQGYQDAFKEKEERNHLIQQQQEQILTELKQHFGIKGEIKMVSPNEPTQQINSQTLEQSWQQLKNLSDKLQQRAKGVEAVEQPSKIVLDKRAYEVMREKLNRRIEDLAFEFLEPLYGKPRRSRVDGGEALRYRKHSSLLVNISGPKQGLFMDFETMKGGDALKLIQNHFGVGYKEAFQWGLSWLGETQKFYELTAKNKDAELNYKEKTKKEAEWTPIFPAPKEAPDLQSYSLRYMMKDKTEKAHFAYKDAEGNILAYVVRLETSDGSKLPLPLTYCRNDKGQTQWKWKGMTGYDRPLYGLDQLALKKEASVLVVEGEKAAEAAKKLFPEYAVITWSGGCGNANKSDWSVVKDRDVIIWPDHDEPGRNAAKRIQEILETHQNLNVAIVDVPSVFPAKWDLADALPEGVQHQDLRNHMATAKMARAQEIGELEVTPKVDMNLLVASQNQAKEPIEISLSSLEQGRGLKKGWSDSQQNKAMDLGVRDQSFVLPPEKEVLAYYQFLEEENKGLLSSTRTPEQQQRVESVNKEMEETAYAISNNSGLMEEAQKNNLTHHIMVDKEAYLQSLIKSQQELTDMNDKPSKEKDILSYYQDLEQENKKLIVIRNKTPEQQERVLFLNKEIERTAYEISDNPMLMKEVQKIGLKDRIMIDREAYLQSQEEKKAITVNDLAIEAPAVPQQTLKTEEISLAPTVAVAEPTPSPALSAVSERELVRGYLEIDEKIKTIPTASSRSEEEKVRYEALFNSSLALSHQISQSPKAMEAITVLGLEENVTLKAERYQRIHQANSQQVQLDEVKQNPVQSQTLENTVAEQVAAQNTPIVTWHHQAQEKIAQGRLDEALNLYAQNGHVHLTNQVQEDIVKHYHDAKLTSSLDERIILVHTPEERDNLISQVRQQAQELGRLSRKEDKIPFRIPGLSYDPNRPVDQEWKWKPFAVGDAILFPKESVELGIQKGERAVLTKMFYNEKGLNFSYQGKDGQEKNFYIAQYPNFDYAYVMTFEQATGQQFKDTFIKVDSTLDYQKTVQALSHHQESCQLYASKARYQDQEQLFQQLERGMPEPVKVEQTIRPELLISEEKISIKPGDDLVDLYHQIESRINAAPPTALIKDDQTQSANLNNLHHSFLEVSYHLMHDPEAMKKMKDLKLEKDVLEKAKLYLEDHFKEKYVDPSFGLKGRVQGEIKSGQDLVGLYVHLEKKIAGFSHKEKTSSLGWQRFYSLYNYCAEISQQISQNPAAMKEIKALNVEERIDTLCGHYVLEQRTQMQQKHSYQYGKGPGMGY